MTVKQAIELMERMPSSIMTKGDVLGLLRTMDGADVADIADINEAEEDEASTDTIRERIEDAIREGINMDDYVSPDDVEFSLVDNYIRVDHVNVDDIQLIDDITDFVMNTLEENFIIKNRN